MISYAQNFEDVMLERVFKDLRSGFYVDIGAMHPEVHSVTKWFYDRGWRGVNVEPNPSCFRLLNEERTRDINIQAAISDSNGKASFHLFATASASLGAGLSSLYKPKNVPQDMQKVLTEIEVPTLTLDELHRRYSLPGEYEFLKIDVEGAEAKVLGGASFKTYRPIVVLVEAIEPGTQVLSHREWDPILVKRGYCFVYFDGLNRFYLRAESMHLKELFSYPPCVFDNFTCKRW